MDCSFPYIKYNSDRSPLDNGKMHGESFRQGIQELCQIRTELLLNRNPNLKKNLKNLAEVQFSISRQFDPDLASELVGIAQGAAVTLVDIVILNNYTDFRDISERDEGCSALYCSIDSGILAGQTWDMHRSAKDYVSVIHLTDNGVDTLIFSLVGCVGMMGFNSQLNMIGVNNINTLNARPGVIWPVLVRRVLKEHSLLKMRKTLTSAQVTSGHSYILASSKEGEIWEMAPGLTRKVERNFHTNHCLNDDLKKIEVTAALSSTSFLRFNLIEKKIASITHFNDLVKLFNNHENYPKSICSHFESGIQDPSFTCGGAIGDFSQQKFYFWRGCKKYDENFVEYNFKLNNGEFERT